MQTLARSLSASDLLMLTDANWRARPRPSPPSAGRERRARRGRTAEGADARIIKDSLCVPPSMKLKVRVSLGFCLHREVVEEEVEAAVIWWVLCMHNHLGCLMVGSAPFNHLTLLSHIHQTSPWSWIFFLNHTLKQPVYTEP